MTTMNMSKREKQYLITGGVVVLIFLIAQFLYFPAMAKKKELARVLDVQKTSLTDMRQLQSQYDRISLRFDNQTDILRSRDKGFSLFSFLDQQAQKSHVKHKVAYMQPFSQESDQAAYSIAKVKLKLNDLYLKELVDFLSQVESGKNAVYVSSLSLSRTGAGQEFIEAVIEAATLMPKESL